MQLFFLVSIGTSFLLTSSYSDSNPYDLGALELVLFLVACAVSLVGIQRYRPSFLSVTNDDKGQYDQIPLDDIGPRVVRPRKQSFSPKDGRPTSRGYSITVLTAILCLTLRIEFYRKISETVQCAPHSYEVLLPLLLAINECRYQEPTPSAAEADEDDPSSSIYDILGKKAKLYILQQKWRYVPSALAISCGCYWVNGLWQTQNSTYICPLASRQRWIVPWLQQLSLLLDFLLAIIAQTILRWGNSGRSKLLSSSSVLAFILLASAMCWMIFTTILYQLRHEEVQWLVAYDSAPSLAAFWLVCTRGIIVLICFLSTLYCSARWGIYQMSALLAASITIYAGISNLLSIRHPFPPNTSNVSIPSFLVLYLGAWSSYRIAQASGQIPPPRSSSGQALTFVSFLLLVLFGFWKFNGVHFHPIDLLMFEAKTQHEDYIRYANTSTDLRSAIKTYQRRYHDEPPPGFDIWHDYARKRSVLIMDDYDQIHKDLLPFRTISPADLRKRTWDMVSNPWNEISGISIRGGRAEPQANVLPTHRWMLEGVSDMLNQFAQHLPDMDIAFNLNDESRVAVPESRLAPLCDAASTVLRWRGKKSAWSVDRASSWLPVATEEYQSTVFENWSFQKNFRRFGSVGCPRNSLSISQSDLSSQSHLCLPCLEPHSMGQFVSNWTLAADICHQPDVATLHGFYLSPAAFKTTHELMPVFSQSKAGRYNDIVYPSSWNYKDKVVYAPVNASGSENSEDYSPSYPDPPFAEKQNQLYWRGATSEGVSGSSDKWQGMTRQRLVHMANNASTDFAHDRTTILLSDPNSAQQYRYYSLPGTALSSLGLQSSTDIKLVDHIARCGGQDCADQEQEFGLVKPVDFQAHWRYKFLFDMDGAGFSGRFLPFLQSRSLPFKTALFREWYDSRIVAWRHFVPIDIRLHGVWSTLAYFAGVDGYWPGKGGRRFKWEAHTMQGEIIAEEGRKWAAQVLRKEDMEVYFFRLLLEWARLTDDKRDELGFAMSSSA